MILTDKASRQDLKMNKIKCFLASKTKEEILHNVPLKKNHKNKDTEAM